MNRQFKFRAFIPEEKRMIYNVGITDSAVIEYKYLGDKMIRPNELNHYGRDDVNIMQWIGLETDDNKEIYEGDVIQWDNGADEDGVIQEYYHVIIKWDEDGACFMGKCPFTDEMYSIDEIIFKSIVGNIYENPEWTMDDLESDDSSPDSPYLAPPW